MAIRLHEENVELLREAIRFTSAEIGFAPRMIEKDYFCSVVLEYLARSDAGLVFKGGTCLAKVHAGFYRLSEDLDFSISTPIGSSRTERSRSASAVKAVVADLPARVHGFRMIEALRGSNNSTQYNAVVGYESPVNGHTERISIQVGVREPVQTAPETLPARTALLDPLEGVPLIEPYGVRSLSYAELMAEKLRAALCRSDVAIRDFFDVDHAAQTGRLLVDDEAFLALLGRKLSVAGTAEPDVSHQRIGRLPRQVAGELRSVLASDDLAGFDLDRAVGLVTGVARTLAGAAR